MEWSKRLEIQLLRENAFGHTMFDGPSLALLPFKKNLIHPVGYPAAKLFVHWIFQVNSEYPVEQGLLSALRVPVSIY